MYLPTHILNSLQNTAKSDCCLRILSDTIRKITKLYVKFTGKIGHMLIADLVYIMLHHLKSICQTLCTDVHVPLFGCMKTRVQKL